MKQERRQKLALYGGTVLEMACHGRFTGRCLGCTSMLGSPSAAVMDTVACNASVLLGRHAAANGMQHCWRLPCAGMHAACAALSPRLAMQSSKLCQTTLRAGGQQPDAQRRVLPGAAEEGGVQPGGQRAAAQLPQGPVPGAPHCLKKEAYVLLAQRCLHRFCTHEGEG